MADAKKVIVLFTLASMLFSRTGWGDASSGSCGPEVWAALSGSPHFMELNHEFSRLLASLYADATQIYFLGYKSDVPVMSFGFIGS